MKGEQENNPHALVIGLISSMKWFLGCDTIVEMNGKILEKPNSIEGAISMLTELSGKTHNVFSGVALICNI